MLSSVLEQPAGLIGLRHARPDLDQVAIDRTQALGQDGRDVQCGGGVGAQDGPTVRDVEGRRRQRAHIGGVRLIEQQPSSPNTAPGSATSAMRVPSRTTSTEPSIITRSLPVLVPPARTVSPAWYASIGQDDSFAAADADRGWAP